VIENTDWLINRYRGQTVALDYYGDSVINSVADTLFMIFGFFLARWWRVWLTIAVAIALELVVGYMIRDNLTLNVLMLLWQAVDPRLASREMRVPIPCHARESGHPVISTARYLEDQGVLGSRLRGNDKPQG
jgi:hypothetical protein